MATTAAHDTKRRLSRRSAIVKQWSIRWQLVFWCVLSLSIVLTVFSASTYLMIRYYLLARVDTELVEESNELAEEVEITKNEREFRRRFQQRDSDEAIFGFRVGRMNGEIQFGSALPVGLQLPQPAADSDLNFRSLINIDSPKGERWRVLGRVIQVSDQLLVIHVLLPIAQLNSQMRMLSNILILNVLFALSAVVFIGYLIAQRVMSPIDNMTTTAERISADNLSERVPVLSPHDELGRLASTLNTTFNRLQRSIDEMRRFTSNAAHELRTPLQVIRTEVEVTLRAEKLHGKSTIDEFRRVAEVTLTESTRLSVLVDQLLSLSRQDAGVDRSQHEPVSLKAILLDVVESLREISKSKGQTIIVGKLADVAVRGDDILLYNLFSNLIENAVKYTPTEGKISVSSVAEAGQVRIAIEDTGIGIDPAHHEHLFKRFYRVDASRNRDGTGLGLAICKSIVQSHDGQIEVDSQLGHGATFTVTFPVIAASGQCEPTTAS